MRIRWFMMSCLACVLLQVSCQPKPTVIQARGPVRAPEAGLNTVVVTQERNGGQVVLKTGQTLLVRLTKSSTPGMTWQMDRMPDQSVLMPDGKRQVRSGKQLKYDSLLSYLELRFEAQAPGETELDLAYDVPGGGEESVERRFTLEVIVESGS